MKRLLGIMLLISVFMPSALAVAQEATETTEIAAPAAPAAPGAAITADENVIIKKIEVTGNFEKSDTDILAVVQSKAGDNISIQKLQDDLQRIFDLGWFSEDVKLGLSEFEGGAKVTFRVTENPVVGKINITGNSAIPTQEVLNVMETKVNSILNKNVLKKDIANIEKLYKDKGFIVARISDIGMDEKNNVNIAVMEGMIQDIEVVYMVKDEENEEITTKNPTGKTKPNVILREMKTKAGDVLNKDKLSKDLQRVYNLGLFTGDLSWDLNTDPAKVQPGKLILQVQVEEAKTGQIGFGAGYSSNTGLTGFLSYSERNFRGQGQRLSTNVEFGKKKNEFQVGYFLPWVDKKQTSFEVNVYNTSSKNLAFGLGGGITGSSAVTTDYQETHRGFDFTLGRPITDNTRAYIGFKAESVTVEPAAYNYLNGAARSVSVSLRTDTRNNIFFPTEGRYDSGTMEYNGKFLGGKHNYQKLSMDLRRFRPMGKKNVLAGHFFMGLGKDDVPRYDYYDIGGVNTVRGYDEFQFSGTKAVYMNAEYRMPLGGNLSGVVFADAGGVWNELKDISFSSKDYVKSIGLGIRLQIPQLGIMGPIRLDYAYAISAKDSKIHFGFGHMF